MGIKLTKIQREEIEHLRGVADDEAETGDTDTRQWQLDRDAFDALLAGNELTPDQRFRLVKEVRWHTEKFDTDSFPEDAGILRSMDNLLKKLVGLTWRG